MANETYNPFPNIGKQFTDGLDFTIANLPAPIADTTFQIINDTVVDYLESLFDGSFTPGPSLPPVIDNLIYSILPNAANCYQNGNLINESFYNETQVLLINSIINAVKNNSVEGISSILQDANKEIAQSGLSAVDQAPLFVAVEIGMKSNDYWINIIATPGTWATFINSNAAINTANLPFWVVASMEGALSGYAQIQQLDMSVANTLNSIGRASAGTAAMVAAVGVSTGKQIFKWVQKPKLNISRIAKGNGSGHNNQAVSGPMGGNCDGGVQTLTGTGRCEPTTDTSRNICHDPTAINVFVGNRTNKF